MAGAVREITKQEVSESVWKRISRAIRRLKLTQMELAALCEEHGYRVSQPEISRLMSGKAQLTLYQMMAFSEALDLPIEQLTGRREMRKNAMFSGGSFITEPTDKAYEGYLGKFCTVFHSTERYTDEFIYGTLVFGYTTGSPVCETVFELDTGARDSGGHRITKRYHGQLVLSSRMGIGYCILVNERMGEICCLEFRHRNFFVKQVQCRLALVLTVSAGELKNPVVHKMLLSRQPITSQLLTQVGPFLKFREGDIHIPQEVFEEWRTAHKKEKLPLFDTGCVKNWDGNLSGRVEPVLSVNEADLRKSCRKLSNMEMAKAVSQLLALGEESYLPYLLYLNEQEDSQVYEIFKGLLLEQQKE